MNLPEIREKVTIFLLPILIVGVVFGGLVALVGKAYFWDVSRVTLRLPGDKTISVRIEVQTRLVYFDADLFGFYYPVHFTIPFSRTQECQRECILDRLPSGDAIITLQETNTPIRIFIEPDTQGVLDLRPSFEAEAVLDPKIIDSFRAPALTPEEQKNINIEKIYPLPGLVMARRNRDIYLYDTKTKQLIQAPLTILPRHVARGEQDGVYMFWGEDGVVVWDRYGRTPVQTKEEIVYGAYTFSWEKTNQTTIVRADGEISLAGFWSPLFAKDEFFITDGQKIMRLR